MSLAMQEKTGGASGAKETMKSKVNALLVKAAAVAAELKKALKGANKKKLAKMIWSVAELKKVRTAIKNASSLKGAAKSKSKSPKKKAAKAKKPAAKKPAAKKLAAKKPAAKTAKKQSYKQLFAAMFAKKPAAKKPAAKTAKKQSYKQQFAAMFAKKPAAKKKKAVRINSALNNVVEPSQEKRTLAQLMRPIPSLLAPKPRSPAKTNKRFVFDKDGNVVGATPVAPKKAKTPPVAKPNKRVKFDSDGKQVGVAVPKAAAAPLIPSGPTPAKASSPIKPAATAAAKPKAKKGKKAPCADGRPRKNGRCRPAKKAGRQSR